MLTQSPAKVNWNCGQLTVGARLDRHFNGVEIL